MIAGQGAALSMTQALTLSSLPLFPLGSVLFPGGLLALRVFEVRYLDMVRKCHHAGAPFGVVSLTQGHEVRRAGAPEERFHDIGTLATIEHLENPQPGLITLLCRGGQRFRIHQYHHLPHGLWVADVGHLDPDLTVPVPQDLQKTATSLAQVLHTLRQRDPGTFGAIAPTAPSPTAVRFNLRHPHSAIHSSATPVTTRALPKVDSSAGWMTPSRTTMRKNMTPQDANVPATAAPVSEGCSRA